MVRSMPEMFFFGAAGTSAVITDDFVIRWYSLSYCCILRRPDRLSRPVTIVSVLFRKYQ